MSMPRRIASPEVMNFVKGLKIIIRNNWKTQEEFAQTVTSKVNMSNILRGHVGTSKAMRQALADRAGMSVEEIEKLGRNADNGNHLLRPLPSSPLVQEAKEYTGGSSAELLNIAAEQTTAMQNELASYTKNLTSLLSDVLAERDKLLRLINQEQAVTNSIAAAIMVVDSNMKVISVNRPMMEQFMVYPKDDVGKNNCPFCGEIEKLVNKVFNKEGVSRGVTLHDGEHYCMTACPVLTHDWKVDRATVLVFSVDPLVDLFKSMGWTPPS